MWGQTSVGISARPSYRTLRNVGRLLHICEQDETVMLFVRHSRFIMFVTLCFQLRGTFSAVAHLWHLHGQLYKFSCVLAGATAVTVQLQLVIAAVLFLLVPLAGRLDVPVRGKTAAHSPLTRVRQQDHQLVETAMETGEKKCGAVIWRQWHGKI